MGDIFQSAVLLVYLSIYCVRVRGFMSVAYVIFSGGCFFYGAIGGNLRGGNFPEGNFIEGNFPRISLFIYLLTHSFKVDNDKKDTVYKNAKKIAWG